MCLIYDLYKGDVRADSHLPITGLFLPPNKQDENVPSVYSITACGLCWGSICSPRSQKGPQVSLMKSESAGVKTTCRFPQRETLLPSEHLWFLICLYLLLAAPSSVHNTGTHPKAKHRWRGLMSTFGKCKSIAKCRWRQTVLLIQLLLHLITHTFLVSLTHFELQMLSRLTNYFLILCHEYLK